MLKKNTIIKFDDLFRIEDGVAYPKTSREAVIPEIKEIIIRSVPIPGDRDNRKKLYAYKELLAVYLLADPRSEPRRQGLRGEDLERRVKEIARLDKSWQIDDTIRKCVLMYKKHIDEEISMRVLSSTVDSLALSEKVINKLKEEVNRRLDEQSITIESISEFNNAISSLLKLSSGVREEIEKLNKVKTAAAAYEKKVEMARGNVPISTSMNPD